MENFTQLNQEELKNLKGGLVIDAFTIRPTDGDEDDRMVRFSNFGSN